MKRWSNLFWGRTVLKVWLGQQICSVINRGFHLSIYLLECYKELQLQNEAIYWSELIFFFSLDSVPYPWSKSADCRTLLIADFLTAKTWLFPNPCSSIVQITKLMWQTCSVFQELQHTCHQIEARMHKSSLYFGSRTDDWNYFLLLTNSPFSRDKLLCSAVNETLGY